MYWLNGVGGKIEIPILIGAFDGIKPIIYNLKKKIFILVYDDATLGNISSKCVSWEFMLVYSNSINFGETTDIKSSIFVRFIILIIKQHE
jgi:hypothetical protein